MRIQAPDQKVAIAARQVAFNINLMTKGTSGHFQKGSNSTRMAYTICLPGAVTPSVVRAGAGTLSHRIE